MRRILFIIPLLTVFLLVNYTSSFAEKKKEDTEVQRAIKIINLGTITVLRMPVFLLTFDVNLSNGNLFFSIDKSIENVLVTIKDENGSVINEKTYNLSEQEIYLFSVNHLTVGDYIVCFTVPHYYGSLYQGGFSILD